MSTASELNLSRWDTKEKRNSRGRNNRGKKKYGPPLVPILSSVINVICAVSAGREARREKRHPSGGVRKGLTKQTVCSYFFLSPLSSPASSSSPPCTPPLSDLSSCLTGSAVQWL